MDWEAIWDDHNQDFLRVLSVHVGVDPDHPKIPALWNLAWQHGHASGIHEVVDYFDEFAELIK